MSLCLKTLSWNEVVPKFNSRGGWNKNVLAEKKFEKLISVRDVYQAPKSIGNKKITDLTNLPKKLHY